MRNYKRIVNLRADRLKKDGYVCQKCGKVGNDTNMGIEPIQGLKDGQKIGINEVVSVHELCVI